jgi:hypothetical protein
MACISNSGPAIGDLPRKLKVPFSNPPGVSSVKALSKLLREFAFRQKYVIIRGGKIRGKLWKKLNELGLIQ